MNAYAEPVVVANDRTHYLHTTVCAPEPGFAGVERHHLAVDCAEVSLLRWHTRQHRAECAVLQIQQGGFELHLDATAEQLRLMAYAMLHAATELGTAARSLQPADAGVDIATLERKPWHPPELRA